MESALNMSLVGEETSYLYKHRYSRPAIQPEVQVKYLLVGFLCGAQSERLIKRRVQTGVALQWYLDLDLSDAIPNHSTTSQLCRHKPSSWKVVR